MPLASLCLHPLYTAKQSGASVYISSESRVKVQVRNEKVRAGKEAGLWLIFKMETGHLTSLRVLL